MTDSVPDAQLEGFLDIRKPGAHLEEGAVADDFVLMLGVDLDNYPKFEGPVTHQVMRSRRLD